jgi:iron complex outermembrane receptor protein
MINFGSVRNWGFDVAYSYTESEGTAQRPGINERNLELSLGWYSASETPCESNLAINPLTGEPVPALSADVLNNCVPVDLFAPSLFESILDNELSTQAERDFLFSSRDFDTLYEQSFITAIISGDLFELPAGTVSAAFGYEYRNDRIDSIPNDVARDGLLFGFFRDLGAVGEKDTEEWFTEFEVPLLANAPGAKELTLNISTRQTTDEFYPTNNTYSGKLGWRPIDNLLIRGTVGTSYRAPNLRENFLLGQSGFLPLSDPCAVPADALELAPGGGVTYDPTNDTRTEVVLENCRRQGIDPTTLGSVGSGASTTVYSVEILRGRGSTDLAEEKSDSWTAGFSWDVELFKDVDLLDDVGINIGATYYEIDIRDSIVQQGAQGSINACYNDGEFDSVFCSNISREDGGTGFINEVRQEFLNRDSFQTRGVDVNMSLDVPVTIANRPVDLSADFNFNRKLQFSDAITDIVTGEVERDSDLGQFGLPEWEGSTIVRADWDDFRLTWSTRYIGSVRIDPDTRAALPFGDLDSGYNTCLGADNGDVDCRPVGEAENYFRHDVSFFYYGDVWTFGVGARNVLDEAPPLVDGRAQFSAWNTPFGAGYDINGRQYFVNVAAAFDDLSF